MASEVPIFRFNFSEEFNRELGYFSKLHKHEDRTEFKENWEEWVNDNNSLINEERKRLINLGYDGNIEDKMYKSVRYYFRKKTNNREPVQRCPRVVVSKELLREIDNHIKNNHFNENYTPQIAYEDFCNYQSDLINIEMQRLKMDDEIMHNKIKKTYKNKFYVIIRQKKDQENQEKNKDQEDNENQETQETQEDEINDK